MKEIGVNIGPVPIYDAGIAGDGCTSAMSLYLPRDSGQMTFGQSGTSPDDSAGQRPRRMSPHGLYRQIGKPLLDILFLFLSLPITLPIMLLCAFALWIEGGNPFYRQARLGKDGRVFWIVKLRTMVRDADRRLQELLDEDPALAEEWRTTQKLRDDPRVTPLGAVLRASSLDELPQLWNVFRGEMSLVGPRPMLPEQLPLYGDPAAYFALRPGLTGLWQVSLRNTAQFTDRARLDESYCANLSCKGDISLLIRTVGVVLRRTGC